MNAQIKIVPTLQMSLPETVKSGAERLKRKRAMFTVALQIRGGVGTREIFEDIVTSLDVSRVGLLLFTSRRGYSVGQELPLARPYRCMPIARNLPRNAQVVPRAPVSTAPWSA